MLQELQGWRLYWCVRGDVILVPAFAPKTNFFSLECLSHVL